MPLLKRQPSVRPWLSPRPRLRLVSGVPFSYDRSTERYFIAPGGTYSADSIWDSETEQGNYAIVPLVWSPSGLALSFDTDGVPLIAGAYTGRQSFNYREWDIATYGLVPVAGGGTTSTYVVGNIAPTVGTIPAQVWVAGIDSNYDLPITSPFDALGDLVVTGTLPTGATVALHTYLPGEPGEYKAWRLEFSLASGAGAASGTISDLTVTDIYGESATFAAFTWQRTDSVQVPCTAGGTLSYADYATLLLAAGLVPSQALYVISSTVPVGNVVEAYPPNPARVALGSLVFVYVSVSAAGEVVPYLIGYTQAPAEEAIAAIYCSASVVNSGGTVVSQSPAPFSQIVRGQSISITMGGDVIGVRNERARGTPEYSTQERTRET